MSKVEQALKSAIEEIKWANHLHDWHEGLQQALVQCEAALAEIEKWAIDYGLYYEPSFTRYDVEAAWQAAIAYMQEQSEPFGIWHVADDPDECEFFLYEDSGDVTCEKCVKLYTTPQRQQPLKRLSEDKINEIWGKREHSTSIAAFANAIMDEIERINK